MKTLAITTLLLAACNVDTAGDRIGFDARAESVAPATAGVLTYTDAATGWTVHLRTARVVIGPLYLWSGKPINPTLRDNADQFQYGALRGQIVEQTVVDALAATPQPLAAGDGLSGETHSAELWLSPPADPIADAAGDVSLAIAGDATRDVVTVPFRGTLTIDDTLIDETTGDTAAQKQRVRGMPFEGTLAEGGTVVVAIDATRWLSGARWDELAATVPDQDGVFVVAPGTAAFASWLYQVRQSGAIGPWRLSWEP